MRALVSGQLTVPTLYDNDKHDKSDYARETLDLGAASARNRKKNIVLIVLIVSCPGTLFAVPYKTVQVL